MLWEVLALHSLLSPNNKPLIRYATFHICSYQLMDIQSPSTFWLLRIMLLRIFTYKFLQGHLLSLVFYLQVELLDLTIIICWTFWGNVKLFSRVVVIFYILTNKYMRAPISPHQCQHLVLSIFLTTAILVDMKWYFITVSICISLMPNDTEHLCMCLFTTCISSLKIYLPGSLAYFLIGFLTFLLKL